MASYLAPLPSPHTAGASAFSRAVRSCLPLRGSPGIAPGSLFASAGKCPRTNRRDYPSRSRRGCQNPWWRGRVRRGRGCAQIGECPALLEIGLHPESPDKEWPLIHLRENGSCKYMRDGSGVANTPVHLRNAEELGRSATSLLHFVRNDAEKHVIANEVKQTRARHGSGPRPSYPATRLHAPGDRAGTDCDRLLVWEESGQNAMCDVVDIVAFTMETVQLARDRVASSWIRWVVYAGVAAVVVLAAAELWGWL